MLRPFCFNAPPYRANSRVRVANHPARYLPKERAMSRRTRRLNIPILMTTGVLGGGVPLFDQLNNAWAASGTLDLHYSVPSSNPGSTLTDLSGNSHNGTVGGTWTYYAGSPNGELETDINTSKITPAGNIWANGRGSFALLIMYRYEGSGENSLGHLYYDNEFRIRQAGGALTVRIVDSAGNFTMIGHTFSANEYAVVCLVANAGAYTLYEALSSNSYQLTSTASASRVPTAMNAASETPTFFADTSNIYTWDGRLASRIVKYNGVPTLATVQAALDSEVSAKGWS